MNEQINQGKFRYDITVDRGSIRFDLSIKDCLHVFGLSVRDARHLALKLQQRIAEAESSMPKFPE